MKLRQSNLHFFFLFLFILIDLSSCSKGTDIDEIVPYTLVDFTYHDNENKLGAENNCIYLDEETIGISKVGYKNHGIILVHLNDGIVAFDATCTNDVESDNHLELDGNFAVCPDCDSKFNILQVGEPFSGSVARYSLKTYKTSTYSLGNHATIRVRN
ncbi:hypothetical protein [Ancylomarina sp. 16SWW S1-10-2]|uniref:hypothetical protein n=1 Tax=Ancylomarina sp. 16SWW S1-10-2 TaxID=2499681 RepID=UPI0012AEAE07|nr:hypothetical protein [Ancylomarina sp. 16SWW S1-10-2]MRT91637.1 hypothetical protein [Ancylomarina sp. 16SWW S1-10-2]